MKIEQRWRVLAALSLARVGMGYQFQSVAATAPLLADSLGFDAAQIGWLVGLYLLPGIAFALPGGMLGARFGDKRMVLIGLALMMAGGLGFAFSSDIVEASFARTAMGVGGVVLNVLLVKMVTDWFAGKELVLAMSILINTWPIGIGIALLTLGALAQSVSWPAAFVATAAMAALGMASVFFGYTPAPGAPVAQKVDLRALARQEWILLGATSLPWMIYNTAYVLSVAFLPIYFVDSGLSIVSAGGITAINTILIIVSVQAGGLLVQRFGHADGIVYCGLAGWALATIGMMTSSAPLPWIIASGLIGGLPAGVLVSLPGEVLRAESRSTGMGIFYTMYYAGVAVVPPIAGAIAVRTASSAAPIWMAVACAATSAGAFSMVRWLQKSAAAQRR
ncbi:MAG: CynX/NimT family MFS transporter [Burkholderiales bacterium]